MQAPTNNTVAVTQSLGPTTGTATNWDVHLPGTAGCPAIRMSGTNATGGFIITDVDCIPDRLCRVVSEPDKAAIKSELMTGTHVPGAHLSNAEPTLSIRTK